MSHLEPAFSAPRLAIPASTSYLTIPDLQEAYEQRYNEPVNYHTIYMNLIRGRIPMVILAGRMVVSGRDVPKALQILKNRRRHRAKA